MDHLNHSPLPGLMGDDIYSDRDEQGRTSPVRLKVVTASAIRLPGDNAGSGRNEGGDDKRGSKLPAPVNSRVSRTSAASRTHCTMTEQAVVEVAEVTRRGGLAADGDLTRLDEPIMVPGEKITPSGSQVASSDVKDKSARATDSPRREGADEYGKLYGPSIFRTWNKGSKSPSSPPSDVPVDKMPTLRNLAEEIAVVASWAVDSSAGGGMKEFRAKEFERRQERLLRKCEAIMIGEEFSLPSEACKAHSGV